MTRIALRSRICFFTFLLTVLALGGLSTLSAQEIVLPLPGVTNRAFEQLQILTASDGAANRYFGIQVAMDGNTLLVGDQPGESGQSAAYVFERDGSGVWSEAGKLAADDAAIGDYFGIDIALQGDTAVIGAPYHDELAEEAGAVYIFTRSSTGMWSQTQKLTITGAPAEDHFGAEVDIDGDYIIAAAQGTDQAYVFRRNASQVWQQETGLEPGGFISDVKIAGDLAVVGTSGVNSLRGAAQLYQLQGDDWSFVKTLKASDGENEDFFGTRVMIHGNQVFIHASIGDTFSFFSGAIYVFAENGGAWTEIQKLAPDDLGVGASFGYSMAAEENTLIGGSYGIKSAYMFTWNGSAWVQADKLVSDGAGFGYSIDLQSGTLASSAVNTNSNQGSVYLLKDPTLVPELLVDGGFENDAAGWDVKGSTGDKVKCNKEDKVIAHTGNCAWRFKGSIGENSRIQQVITGIASTQLTLGGYVSATGVIDSQVKVVVNYVEAGLAKSKLVVDVTSETGGGYVPLSNFQPVLTVPVISAIKSIKVQVKNRTISGKLFYDELSLISLPIP